MPTVFSHCPKCIPTWLIASISVWVVLGPLALYFLARDLQALGERVLALVAIF